MPPFGLQRADKGQFEFFLRAREIRKWFAAPHLWQPRRAALFDGFNGDLLPFFALVFRAVVIELRHDAFGQQRHNAVRAQLDGFLDDALDDFSLRHAPPAA